MTRETAEMLRERIRQLEGELVELRATMTLLISDLYTTVHEVERWQQPANLDRLKSLRDYITKHFDKGELQTMCFDLGVNYDDLDGDGLSDKARELVLLMNRNGRCDELFDYCKQNRPNVSFPHPTRQ